MCLTDTDTDTLLQQILLYTLRISNTLAVLSWEKMRSNNCPVVIRLLCSSAHLIRYLQTISTLFSTGRKSLFYSENYITWNWVVFLTSSIWYLI